MPKLTHEKGNFCLALLVQAHGCHWNNTWACKLNCIGCIYARILAQTDPILIYCTHTLAPRNHLSWFISTRYYHKKPCTTHPTVFQPAFLRIATNKNILKISNQCLSVTRRNICKYMHICHKSLKIKSFQNISHRIWPDSCHNNLHNLHKHHHSNNHPDPFPHIGHVQTDSTPLDHLLDILY